MLAYDISSLGICDFWFFLEKRSLRSLYRIIMWIRRVYASHTLWNGKLYKSRRENSTKGSIGEGYTTTALTGCASPGINSKPNNKKMKKK